MIAPLREEAVEGLIGRTLNHYRVLEDLGAGGMGRVYLAEDTRLGRNVALKILPPEMASDAERLERFEHEARVVAGLSHPNIVTLHSIEEADGIRFISMERVEGKTLRQLIPKDGLPLKRFFELAIPLVDAVGAAHERGVTHRDLKPENVMVTTAGRVKVLDFGLAKLQESAFTPLDEARTASITQDGRILGTVAYMSPEQAEGKPLDHRSDIFSLGILLYEVATGERPFKGDTNLSILSAILKDTPPPVSERRAELPRPLSRMIQRALEKKPGDRYQSAADLRQDLEDLKRDVETGEVVSGTRLALVSLGKRRVPLLAAVVVLLVALGIAAAVTAVRRRGPAPVVAGSAAHAGPSLAVFYFENLTGEPSLDWLRTGLTDMLVTDLSQSAGLRVLSTARLYQILDGLGQLADKTTSFEAIQAVAREAGVERALVGSYLMSGGRLRISVKLQDARTGEVLASERVEGEGEGSILRLADELTRRVKERLGLRRAAGSEPDRDLEEVTTSSIEAYRQYAEGYALHNQGREQDAIPKLEKAVELDPGFAMAMAKLSVTHGNLGDQKQADLWGRRALERVERLSPRERYYIEGVSYSRSPATLSKALESYRMAVERFPDHAAARNNLAMLLLKFGRPDEALAHLEELRKGGMNFSGTVWLIAEAYAWKGDVEKGVEITEELLARDPGSAPALAALGMQQVALGRYDAAMATADRLSATGQQGEKAEGIRSAALALSGRWDEARQRAEGAVRTAKKPLERLYAYWILASIEAYTGRMSKALAHLDEVARLSTLPAPARARSHLSAADMLYAAGRYEPALNEARRFAEAVKGTPEEGHGNYVVGVCLTRLKRGAEAATELAAAEKSLAALPRELLQVQEPCARANVALARDEPARAIELLVPVLPRLPEQGLESDDAARVRHQLGLAYMETGQDAEAVRWLTRFTDSGLDRLKMPVQYARSLYRLGQLHEKRGDAAKAREYYRLFAQLWKDGELDREQVADAARKAESPAVAAR